MGTVAQSHVFDVAARMAARRMPLSPEHALLVDTDYMVAHKDARVAFGRAVGRVLSRAALLASADAGHSLPAYAQVFNAASHHSLEDCLASIAAHLPLSAEALSLALYYVDRLQSGRGGGVITWGNIERIYAVAIVVASKYAYDRVYTNRFYAKVLGVDVDILNKMEIALLRLLEFSLSADNDRWAAIHDYVATIAFEQQVPQSLITLLFAFFFHRQFRDPKQMRAFFSFLFFG